jgi:hypothetical protein
MFTASTFSFCTRARTAVAFVGTRSHKEAYQKKHCKFFHVFIPLGLFNTLLDLFCCKERFKTISLTSKFVRIMLIHSRILILAVLLLGNPVLAAMEGPVPEAPIVLIDNYVQFETPQKVKSKYYSLLNWKTYSRSQPTVVPKYKRIEQFGRWINDPNDDFCYNTRALVLIRDSKKDVTFDETDKCNVISGRWKDDYTGQTFTTHEDIQIDHFVPLKNAYLSGAYKWSFKARCLYANYLGYKFHLKSVNASQNMKKGDKGPDRYMPPNNEYTCPYLKNWLTVKFLWGLRMTESEATAITQLMKDNHCRTSEYRISGADILKQKKYVTDHIDLCEDVTPQQVPTPE